MTALAVSTSAAVATAWALCYAGMAGLCLAMDRHHAQVWRREPSATVRRALRTTGSLLLLAALWPCVSAWGGSVGVVAWLGFLSAGALLLAGLLPYAPRAACAAALVAPACVLLAASFGLPS